MRIKAEILAFLLSGIFACGLFASCADLINDYSACPGDNDKKEEGVLDLAIELHTPAGKQTAPTRSLQLDDDKENLINEVTIILFSCDDDNDPVQTELMIKPYWFERDGNEPSLYHARCACSLPASIQGKNIRVGILANGAHLAHPVMEQSGQLLSATGNDAYAVEIEYRELQQKLVTHVGGEEDLEDLAPRLPQAENNVFVMWALPPDRMKVKGNINLTVEGCLMRDLAKVEVHVMPELKASGRFDFRTVHIYKPSTTVMHLPHHAAVNATVDDKSHPYYYTTAPTLHEENRVFTRWDYEEEAEEGEFVYRAYIPEGEVTMKGKNGGVGKPRDINHTNRPAVVVGGYYNGAETMSYYRIEFADFDGNLVEILRNHHYDINIKDVIGPGQPTPDEAYDNNHVMIVAEITDWCMVERDIMFEGPDWITVSKRVINLTGNAGSGTTFVIDSSVDLDEWEFKLGEDGTFTKDPLLESRNFCVTRPIAEKGSKLLVVTKHDKEPYGTPVTEKLYVRIGGRVLFYVTITQWPMLGDYWFLGEFFPGDQGPWQAVINFPIGGADPQGPFGSFLDFLNWLFAGSFQGPIGEGDNISEAMLINKLFWEFLTWFFTDPYGHIIGGDPGDWGESYENPIAVIIFDFYKWMLGDKYYFEIKGPDWDPDNPGYVKIGPMLAIKFYEWFKLQDFVNEIYGPKFDDNGDLPDYTTLGMDVLIKFIDWMRVQDFYDSLKGSQIEGGYDPDKDNVHYIEMMLNHIKWYLDKEITGILGNENKEDPGGDPGGDDPKPSGIDKDKSDANWELKDGNVFEKELPVKKEL